MPFIGIGISVLRNIITNFFTHADPAGVSDEEECILTGGIPRYDSQGHVICERPTDPAPNSPKRPAPPVISSPPQVIYRDRIVTKTLPGETVYIPVPVPIPQLPPRRLKPPPIPVDTKSTQTSPGKTIKIHFALDEIGYGTLLHEPISGSPVTLRVCVDKDFDSRFQERQEAAATNYVLAIGSQILDSPSNQQLPQPNQQPPQPKAGLCDIAVALINRNFNTFIPSSTKILPIFSCQGINELISYYLNRSLSNFQISSTIPSGFSVINYCEGAIYPAPDQQIVDIFNKLEIARGGTGAQDLVQKIATAIGVDDYPVTVPETFITQAGSTPQTQQLTSLSQFFYWYVKRFDELMGQWEIPIEVQGLNDKGEIVNTKIRLPNLAESIGELFGSILHVSTNSEILVNLATRNLVESGQIKQQDFKSYMLLEAIIEYMGFKHKDVNHKMPLLFTPGTQDLHTLLQATEVDVAATEFDDKYTMRSHLVDLLNAAAIIRAVFFKKLDKNNLENDIFAKIKGFSETTDKITKDGGGDLDSLVQEMQTFLEKHYKTGTKYPKIKRLPNE